jgi:hypothetical protein
MEAPAMSNGDDTVQHRDTGEEMPDPETRDPGDYYNPIDNLPDYTPPPDDYYVPHYPGPQTQDYDTFQEGVHDIDVYTRWMLAIEPAAIRAHATHWRRVSSMLEDASRMLQRRREALAEAWGGAAAQVFLEHVDNTKLSTDDWTAGATNNAALLDGVVEDVEFARDHLFIFANHYYDMRAAWQNNGGEEMIVNSPSAAGWTVGNGIVVDEEGPGTVVIKPVNERGEPAETQIRRLYQPVVANVMNYLASRYVDAHVYVDQRPRFRGPTELAPYRGEEEEERPIGSPDRYLPPSSPGGAMAPPSFPPPGFGGFNPGVVNPPPPPDLPQPPGGDLQSLPPIAPAPPVMPPGGVMPAPPAPAPPLAPPSPPFVPGVPPGTTPPVAPRPPMPPGGFRPPIPPAPPPRPGPAPLGQLRPPAAPVPPGGGRPQLSGVRPPVPPGGMRPGAVPPSGARPGALPSGARPGALPSGARPGAVPPGARPGAVPPGARPGAVPPGARPGAVPPGAAPPGGRPGAAAPGARPGAVPPAGARPGPPPLGAARPGPVPVGAARPGATRPGMPGPGGVARPAQGGPTLPGATAQARRPDLRTAIMNAAGRGPGSAGVPQPRLGQSGQASPTVQRGGPALAGTAGSRPGQPASTRATGPGGGGRGPTGRGPAANRRSLTGADDDRRRAAATSPDEEEPARDPWAVPKPTGLIQSAEPEQPAPHGKPIEPTG